MRAFLLSLAALGLVLPAAPAAAVTCPLTVNQSYKSPDASAVYFVSEDCKKRPFKHARSFFSYFDSWDEVKVVTQAQLNSVPNHELGFLPWGPKRQYKNGTLMKATSDPRVYLYIDGQLHPISDPAVFKGVGFQWSWVEDTSVLTIAKYPKARIVTNVEDYPKNLAFKYADAPDVYVLEQDDATGERRKRHIENEAAFKALGYRLDRVAVFSRSVTFADAEPRRIVLRAKDPDANNMEENADADSTPVVRRSGSEATKVAPPTSDQAGQEISDCADVRLSRSGVFEACKGSTVVYGDTGISFDMTQMKSNGENSTVTIHLRREGLASEDHQLTQGEWLDFTHNGQNHRIRMNRVRLVQQADDGAFFRLDTIGSFDLESE